MRSFPSLSSFTSSLKSRFFYIFFSKFDLFADHLVVISVIMCVNIWISHGGINFIRLYTVTKYEVDQKEIAYLD